jgi:hypothetical protein
MFAEMGEVDIFRASGHVVGSRSEEVSAVQKRFLLRN